MERELKICQNCKKEFAIEPPDFIFYEKMNVPAPTWCPECRLQRRLAFRNEKRLYRRKCDLTGKEILSVHAPDAPFKVYEVKEWFSDKWDPMQYGREYDFSKPFFQQFYELMREVPRMSLMIDYPTLLNSDYTNLTGHLKNCYLITDADFDENCSYATSLSHSKDSFDVLIGVNLELSYECLNCRKCSKVYFSEDCEDCLNVWFSKNLVGCSYCVGCVNLRKKQYYIYNEPYSKEEYFRRIAELGLDSYQGAQRAKEKARSLWLTHPQKYTHERHNTNVRGDYIYYSKNSFWCDQVVGVEDSKYCQISAIRPTRDCYDYTEWGNGAELLYECLTVGEGASKVKFSNMVWPNVRDIEYSMQCQKSHHLFGCIGLRNQEYCIFNKQYSAYGYEALRKKIIAHMNEAPYIDTKGRVYRYGEFFPMELSPFAYNETSAQDHFPLTKEEIERCGYSWRDVEMRKYAISMPSGNLPDKSGDIPDSILQEIIGCEHEGKCDEGCSAAFKIIPAELQFYKSTGIPLPRLCPNCRHSQRIRRRNPMKFWHRKCSCAGVNSENRMYKNIAAHLHGSAQCPNEFETSYAPDRPEIVYCEACYQSEII